MRTTERMGPHSGSYRLVRALRGYEMFDFDADRDVDHVDDDECLVTFWGP